MLFLESLCSTKHILPSVVIRSCRSFQFFVCSQYTGGECILGFCSKHSKSQVTQNKCHIRWKMAEPHWTLLFRVFNSHKSHSVSYNVSNNSVFNLVWITLGGSTRLLVSSAFSSVQPFLCGRRREELRHWLEDDDHAVNLGVREHQHWTLVSPSKHALQINSHIRGQERILQIFCFPTSSAPLLYLFGTWYLVILPHFHFSPLIGKSRSLISASSLSGPLPAWDSIWTSLIIMLACHRRAQSARPVGGGGVVTNEVALLISVLMGHYSGLYPPPFRLGSHTGSGCALGITLNKQSNTILLGCVTVFASLK